MYQHVIICDQQKLYALGSYSILKEQSMFETYCMIQDLKEIDYWASKHPGSLLILDSALLNFNHKDGLSHFNELQKEHPIMVIINEEDDLQLFRLIDAGITGPDQMKFVTKSAGTGILISSFMRFILFLAAVGIVSKGIHLNKDNPAATVFETAGGRWGLFIFGIV
jgi:DNA-binding NarL/FixJ family response regulator